MEWTWTHLDSSREYTITLTAFQRGVYGVHLEWFQGRLRQACPPSLSHSHRYARDVNTESLDVLNHKRLLDSSRSEPNAVSFQVRPVDVASGTGMAVRLSSGNLDLRAGPSGEHVSPSLDSGIPAASPFRPMSRPLPRPAFGSSPNLQVGQCCFWLGGWGLVSIPADG